MEISAVSSGSDSPKRCFLVPFPFALLPHPCTVTMGESTSLCSQQYGTRGHLLEGTLLPAIKNVNAMQFFDKLSATLKLGFKSRESRAVPESQWQHCFQPKATPSVYIFLGFVIFLSSSFFTCFLFCIYYSNMMKYSQNVFCYNVSFFFFLIFILQFFLSTLLVVELGVS